MDVNGNWSLAPAFDVTHAHNPLPDKWTKQHQMSINGKFAIKDITIEDLLAVAKKFSINNPKRIISKVKDSLLNWDDLARKHNLSDNQRITIGEEIKINLMNIAQ